MSNLNQNISLSSGVKSQIRRQTPNSPALLNLPDLNQGRQKKYVEDDMAGVEGCGNCEESECEYEYGNDVDDNDDSSFSSTSTSSSSLGVATIRPVPLRQSSPTPIVAYAVSMQRPKQVVSCF